MYCKKCGGKIESYASNCAFCGAPVEKYDTTVTYVKQENATEEVQGMTTARWIGFMFLNAIPFVGNFIYIFLLFKWAFSSKDKTLRSYARATLIVFLIGTVFIILILMVNMAAIMEFIEEVQSELPSDYYTYE